MKRGTPTAECGRRVQDPYALRPTLAEDFSKLFTVKDSRRLRRVRGNAIVLS